MLSNIHCRLRTLAPALILLVILGILTPAAAFARNPYDLADHNEGDPGDGVLDPAADSDPAVAGSKSPLPDIRTTGYRSDDRRAVPWSEVYLVSLPFSGGLPGQGVLLVLPQNWWRPHAAAFLKHGRWHDAP